MNDRLEIATRITIASITMGEEAVKWCDPKVAHDIAENLIAEDAKRTAAEPKPAFHPVDYDWYRMQAEQRDAAARIASNTPAELAPLVVEKSERNYFNIHTPDGMNYYCGHEGWKTYETPTGHKTRILGSYKTREEAEDDLAEANATRPDRPAKEAKPIVMDAKDCQHRYIRQVVTCGVGSVWVCCGCDKEIATPSTLPPPPKPAARWRAASERPETWTPIVMRGVVGARPNTVVEVGSIVYGIGWHDNQVLRCGGEPVMAHEWCYLSEVLPE